MSTHRFGDRRSFLRGLAATGVLLPAAAYGQAATDTGPERNQSSFRTRHWRDFYPTLGKGVLLADVTSRAVHYWSGDESVHFVFPCAIPMTEDLTRRGQTEIVRKMPKLRCSTSPCCVSSTSLTGRSVSCAADGETTAASMATANERRRQRMYLSNC